jgi:hypothetical protein
MYVDMRVVCVYVAIYECVPCMYVRLHACWLGRSIPLVLWLLASM